eukprot:6400443-Heterocapsa_arctica.AAC.1
METGRSQGVPCPKSTSNKVANGYITRDFETYVLPRAPSSTASFHTKKAGFGGFDPNEFLIYVGWVSPT